MGDASMTTNEPPLQKILVVEDEPDIQTVAEIALSAVGGFDVLVCASGDDAVASAFAFAPDLILLDVMMPDLDGPATLQKLRGLPGLDRTPVVFMTAKVQPHEIAQYRVLGALGVIAKPFDAMSLASDLRAIWASRPR